MKRLGADGVLLAGHEGPGAMPRILALGAVLILLLLLAWPAAAKPSTPEIGARLLLDSVQQLLVSQPLPKHANQPESAAEKRLEELFEDIMGRYRWFEDILALPGVGATPLGQKESEELLRLIKAEPDCLDRLGVFLPRSPELMAWVASQYSGPETAPEWVLANSPGFRAGLIERAESGGEISLTALAMVDWAAAEPILQRMLKGKDYMIALRAMLYHPASADQARRQLLAIVKEPNAEYSARAQAAEGLLRQDWPGSDELFASMLEDPIWHSQFRSLIDPFEAFVHRHPEWQRKLLQLLDDPKPAVRRNAIVALSVLIEGSTPNPEVVRAFLPWLANPDWGVDTGLSRSHLIKATTHVRLPEAVPGLLTLLKTEKGDLALEAAVALEHYDPPGFREAWQVALAKATTQGDSLAEIGVRQGWFTLKDQVDAVAQELMGYERPAPEHPDLSVGAREHLAATCIYGEPRPELTAELTKLARAWYLEDRPQLAALEDELLSLPGADVDAYMLERLNSGDVSLKLLRTLLSRHQSLQTTSRLRLQQMVAAGGPQAGVALVLLRDGPSAGKALASGDVPVALALVASARLVGMPLAVPSLEAASAQPELREAVLAYLKSSESQEHLALLKRLGEGYQISGRTTGERWIEKAEASLVARYRQQGEGELFALQSQHEGPRISLAGTELWVSGDKAELLFEDNKLGHLRREEDAPSYERRMLSQAELDQFRDFIAKRSVDDWTPWDNVTGHHFTSFQYLHLTPEGGRRVVATFNEGTDTGGGGKYEELISLFANLKDKPSQTVYQIQKEVPGVRVLEDNSQALAICSDEEGLKVREEDRRHNISWRLLTEKGLGAPCAPALGYPVDPPPETFNFRPTALANGLFLTNDTDRLIVRRPDEREKTFLKGFYANPALDSERRQGLLLKWENRAMERWSYELVDFTTGTVRSVPFPPGVKAYPLAYLPGRQAFLAATEEQSDRLEKIGYLVDAKSGTVTPVTGEFRPWLQAGERPLQSAGGTRYWATIRTELGTEIGTIDEQSFVFESMAHYPTLRFGASQMWVHGDQVYLAIGDILVLPLNPK